MKHESMGRAKCAPCFIFTVWLWEFAYLRPLVAGDRLNSLDFEGRNYILAKTFCIAG